MKTLIIETTVSLNGADVSAIVGYKFYPGSPGKYNYSNGDPGYPETSAEIEILSVSDESGKKIDWDSIKNDHDRLDAECYKEGLKQFESALLSQNESDI